MRYFMILTALFAFNALPAQAAELTTTADNAVSCDTCGCQAAAADDKPCDCKGDCKCKKDGDKPCDCKGDCKCKKDGEKACGCEGDCKCGDATADKPCGCGK